MVIIITCCCCCCYIYLLTLLYFEYCEVGIGIIKNYQIIIKLTVNCFSDLINELTLFCLPTKRHSKYLILSFFLMIFFSWRSVSLMLPPPSPVIEFLILWNKQKSKTDSLFFKFHCIIFLCDVLYNQKRKGKKNKNKKTLMIILLLFVCHCSH